MANIQGIEIDIEALVKERVTIAIDKEIEERLSYFEIGEVIDLIAENKVNKLINGEDDLRDMFVLALEKDGRLWIQDNWDVLQEAVKEAVLEQMKAMSPERLVEVIRGK